jgi:hypothetical protein
MTELTRRTASLEDLKDIWELLRVTAAEIPFNVRDEAAQESMLTEAMACCIAGLSPIALNKEKAVVGALLVRRDDFEWGFRNKEALHIAYAVVAGDCLDGDILSELVTDVQGRKTEILASIKSGNQLGLTETFGKLGFTRECSAENGWGELFKWQPEGAA